VGAYLAEARDQPIKPALFHHFGPVPKIELHAAVMEGRVAPRHKLAYDPFGASEGSNAMNDTTVDLDQTEEETLDLFTDDVSDDALEAAAGGTGLPVVTMGPGSCFVPGGMVC
jgi:hypothetical protein